MLRLSYCIVTLKVGLGTTKYSVLRTEYKIGNTDKDIARDRL